MAITKSYILSGVEAEDMSMIYNFAVRNNLQLVTVERREESDPFEYSLRVFRKGLQHVHESTHVIRVSVCDGVTVFNARDLDFDLVD